MAGINLALFAALFSLVLWAYAQAMYVSFGTDMSEFKDIYGAYVNTFKVPQSPPAGISLRVRPVSVQPSLSFAS
eukprot:1240625-Rhodomonas_salina.3